jgi:hypothetical protein
VIDPDELARRQTAAASALAGELGDQPWTQAVLRVNSVGVMSEASGQLRRPDGSVEAVAAPDEATSELLDLRERMSGDGHGAWLGATLTLTRSADGGVDFRADYNYDTRPAWQIEPDDLAYIEDLERHPRRPEEVPDWYPRGS